MPFARLATATTPTCHIGLGLAAVGRPGYINLGRDDDLGETAASTRCATRTHELLDAAYAQGVRYFDAARSYGRSEEFLADWLNARPDARRRRGRQQVGLHLHRRLAHRRRGARGQGPQPRRRTSGSAPRPAPCSATGSTSTRSTR